jgi:hypothetical protein
MVGGHDGNLHSCGDDHMVFSRTGVPELVNIMVSFHNDILNEHSHSVIW